jgi:hypothetical protein
MGEGKEEEAMVEEGAGAGETVGGEMEAEETEVAEMEVEAGVEVLVEMKEGMKEGMKVEEWDVGVGVTVEVRAEEDTEAVGLAEERMEVEVLVADLGVVMAVVMVVVVEEVVEMEVAVVAEGVKVEEYRGWEEAVREVAEKVGGVMEEVQVVERMVVS